SSRLRLRPKRDSMIYAHAILAVTAALFAAGALAQQTQVSRCEGKDGTVTYSNRECPPGTTPVRKVNTSPSVSVPDQQAAKDRARKDVADAKQLDKEQKQQEAEAKRAADKRAKAELKIADRCERARRDLARAIEARNALDRQAAKVEQMQKANQEISKREAELPRYCST
ncbi:MAG: DUF4124 domain-containing protein, partial [Burkholderiaceae bacterium]